MCRAVVLTGSISAHRGCSRPTWPTVQRTLLPPAAQALSAVSAKASCLPLPHSPPAGTMQGQAGLTLSPQPGQEPCQHHILHGMNPTGLPCLAQGRFLKNLLLQRALTTGWQSSKPNSSSQLRRDGTCPLQFLQSHTKPAPGAPHPASKATAQSCCPKPPREQTNHTSPVDPKPPGACDPTKNSWFSTNLLSTELQRLNTYPDPREYCAEFLGLGDY